jgi:hypothetical protein
MPSEIPTDPRESEGRSTGSNWVSTFDASLGENANVASRQGNTIGHVLVSGNRRRLDCGRRGAANASWLADAARRSIADLRFVPPGRVDAFDAGLGIADLSIRFTGRLGALDLDVRTERSDLPSGSISVPSR